VYAMDKSRSFATFDALDQRTIVRTKGESGGSHAMVANRIPDLISMPNRKSHQVFSTGKRFEFLLCLLLTVQPAAAGGSWGRVVIDKIVMNGVDYTLVVTPSESANTDPYFGRCRRFEVRGTYRWLKGTWFHQAAGLT